MNGTILYVSSLSGHNPRGLITRIGADGSVMPFATMPDELSGITFGAGRILYVAANQFFSTSPDSAIRKITPDGSVSLFAQLPDGSLPRGLAVDSKGNFYTANDGASTVSKITPAGTVSVLAGVSTDLHPGWVAIDKYDHVYTTQYRSGENPQLFTLIKITPAGVVSDFVTLPGEVGGAAGVFGADGNLYVTSGPTIFQITPAGTASTFVTLPPGAGLTGIAFDWLGNLYVVNDTLHTLVQITPDGSITSFANGLPENTGYLVAAPRSSSWTPFPVTQVAIDPLSLVLTHEVYIKLKLPRPPSLAGGQIRELVSAMSPEEKQEALARAQAFAAYFVALEEELRGNNYSM